MTRHNVAGIKECEKAMAEREESDGDEGEEMEMVEVMRLDFGGLF